MARAHSFRAFLRNILRTGAQAKRKRRRPKLFHDPAVERLEDRLAPAGDILLTGAGTNSNVFQEYTPTGTLLRTVPVPTPSGDIYPWVASIAEDANGNVYVYDGRSVKTLAIYNGQTGDWNQLTYSDWNTSYGSGDNGLALYSHYAYVNNETGYWTGLPGGVIRFDLNTGVGTQFDPFNSDTVSVAMGLDGNLYALGSNIVYELDPNTMAVENTINLPADNYRGIAIDSSGDIYTASYDGTINCFNPSGTLIASTTVTGEPDSIALASDGTLAIGTVYSGVVQMTSAFTNVTSFSVSLSSGAPFVGFADIAAPGPASPAQSIVTCSDTTLQSGTMTAEVTLTAKDANGLREDSGGLAVQFGLSGTATAGFSSVTDNGDGTYNAYFTATSPGTANVTATINGQPVTSTLPSLTVTPSPTLGNILVTLTPSSGPNTFEVLTQAGAVLQTENIPTALGGAGGIAGDYAGDVYISHGTTDVGDIAAYDAAGGTWSALTASGWGGGDGGVALDGNYLYTASNGGSNGGIIRFDLTTDIGTDFDSSQGSLHNAIIGLDGNLYAMYGACAVLEFDPVTMNLLNTVQLPYTWYYGLAVNASGDIYATEYNSNVDEFNPQGVMINQAQAPSNVGSLTGMVNGPNGSLIMTGTGGNVASMTGALTLISDYALGDADTAAFQPLPIGPPAQDVFTTEPPANVGVGTPFGATVTVEDSNGNTVQTYNGPVTISVASSTNGGTIGGTTTVNAVDGVATFTNLIRTVSGTCTLLATVGTFSTTSSSMNITPGAFDLSQSMLSVGSANDPSGVQDTVTFTAEDMYGNQLTSGGLSVAFGQAGGTSTGSIGAVTDNNNGTYTAPFTGDIAGSAITITATVGGSTFTGTLPTITVVPGAASLAQSIVTAAPPTIQSGSTATVTLTAKDAAGNLETTGGLSVGFGFGAGTSTGTLSGVTDHGNGTYTATFTGLLVGTARTITATIGGGAVTSALPAVTVVVGPASTATSTIAVVPGSIPSGDTATVTLTTRDAAGNPETSGGLSVGFGLGGGTSTGTYSGFSDNGNGTYSETFTGILAGTARTITASIGGSAVTSTLPTVTVTPGPVSLSQSTITVASGTVASGSTDLLTLTARDANGNQEASGELSVAFAVSGGSTGSIGPVTDHGNGVYTALFTGDLVGSPSDVSATIGGSAVTSAAPTITVIPGPFSLAQSTISVVPSSIQSGTTATVTLTARDADGNQELTGGLTVAFGLGGGTSTGNFNTVTDNGDGTYSTTFTGVLAGSPRTITATIGGGGVTSTLPSVTVTAGPVSPAQSLIVLSPADPVAGGTSTVTLIAKDAAGNFETTGGLSVGFGLATAAISGSFSPIVDHGNGSYTSTFTAGPSIGTDNVTGTIGASPVTSAPAITIIPGPVSLATSTVSITPGSIQSGNSATVTLTTYDAFGNAETSGGLAVGFGLGAGNATGTFGPVDDEGNGVYTATFTGVLAGANTIVTTIGGSAVTSPAPGITVTPGPVSLVASTITVGPASVPSGSTSTITLTARDAAGNREPTGGLSVAFNLSGGTSTGTVSAVTDDGNGTYTATFTGVLAGTARVVSATIGGSAVTSPAPTLTVTPGPFSLAQSTVAIAPASVQSGTNAVVTLTARDAAGNQEATGGLSVGFSLGAGLATGSFGTVTDNGNGTYAATFTGLVAGTSTIDATINSLNVASTAPTVTVTPGPFSLAQSFVTVSPGSVVSGNTATVTLITRDAGGNLITSGGLNVLFGLGAGGATGTFGGVVDHGNGTYTAVFTGVLAGSPRAITATIDGSAVTSVLPTVAVTPGAISLAQSTVSIAPSSLQSGSTAVVTLVARDAAGNQEATGGLAVAFSFGVGTSTGVFSGVSDHGNGTYTANLLGVLAGSPTVIAATINGAAVTSAPASVTVIPGPVSLAQSTITVHPASLQAGAAASVTLTARDADGNQETSGGLTVAFSTFGGSSTGVFSGVVDQGDGVYSSNFTGDLAGTPSTILATIGGNAVTSSLPTVTVVPGPVSLAESTVTIAPGTVASHASAVVTLTARDAEGNAETSGGLSVAFGLGAGSSTGTFSAVTDNGNGSYTASFTGVLAGSPTPLTATIGGNPVGSTLPSITVVPGAVSLASSTVTVSQGTLVSGTVDMITLTARDAAGNVELGGGLGVAFMLTGGTSTGSLSAVTDNGNGTYTADFTGQLAGSALSVGATIGGNALSSAEPTIAVIPGAVSLATSTVSVSPVSIASGTAALVTLIARDAAGNQEPNGGLNVAFGLGAGNASGAFSAATDHGNGVYTALFTGGLDGTNTIVATLGGQALTSFAPTITVTAGAFSPAQSSITVAPDSILAGGTALVTLSARDAAGNLIPTGGLSVTFGLSGAAGGLFGAVDDHGNGLYTSTFTGTIAGTSLVTATVNAIALTAPGPDLTVVPGPLSLAKSSVALFPATIASGTTTTAILTARDAYGNQEPSGGLSVLFGLGAGSATANFGAVTDNSNGTYAVTLTGVLAGTNAVSATIGGLALTSTPATLAVTPNAFSLAQTTVSVAPASIASGSSAVVTLTLRDADGNQEATGGYPVLFTLGAGAGTGTFSAVTDNGNGTYTASFTGVLAGANTISATVNALPVTSGAAAITVTPGPVSLTQSTVAVTPGSIIAGDTATVTLTARDAAGNLETAGGLSVTFGLGSGTVGGAFSNLVDHHDGVYTATFTGAAAGANTVTASIGAQSVTSAAPSISVTAGPVSVAQSTVSIAPASVPSGSAATVTLVARDAAGNIEQGGGLTVSFGLGAGNATGFFTNLVDEGNGVYTAFFNGVLAGTNTISAVIDGVPLTSSLPSVAVTPGPVSLANSTLTLSASSVLSGTATTATLTARDAAGNQESSGGLNVAFSLSAGSATGTFGSITDHGDGTYTARFTGVLAGAGLIGASIGSQALTATQAVTVTPGAVSLARSTVTLAPANIVSGSGASVTLIARDAAGNQEASGGLAVAFALGAGGATGTFSQVADQNDGAYTAVFTAALAGSNTLQAYLDGQLVTSALPTFTVSPGPVSLAQSTITLSSATIASGSATTLTLTARDAAGNQEPTGGLAVAFNFFAGAATGTLGTVTDQHDGVYTAVFTGVLAGTKTIGASIDSQALTSTYPTITVVPGAVSLSRSVVTVAPASIQAGSAATVTLTAEDANGNLEANGGLGVAFVLGAGNATGAFSPVVDNHNGTFTAAFTGIVAGSNTISATINGQSITTSPAAVAVTAGPVSLAESTIRVSPVTVSLGNTTTVTLTARDAYGNQESSGGLNVAFALGTGNLNGTFSTVTELGNGVYTAILGSGTQVGSSTVTATIDNQAVTSPPPTVNVTPGPVSPGQSTVAISPAAIASGSSATVTLTARDADGNQESAGGLAVSFGLAGGSATGSFSAVTDHGNGLYTATFTGTLAGADTVTASIGGQPVPSTATVAVTPGPFSPLESTIAVSPGSIVSGSTALVTLTTRDAAGNPEITGGLGVVFGLGSGTASGTFGAVTDLGNGVYTAVFTGLHAGSNTVGAAIDGQSVTSALPSVTVVPGAVSLSQSVVAVSPAAVALGSSTTVTLTAEDANGNPVGVGGLHVAFALGAGGIHGAFGTVVDHGNGVYTATLSATGTTIGAAPVTATINAQGITSPPPSVTFTAGPASAAESDVSVANPTIPAGGSTTVTLIAKDAQGNPESTGGLNVAFNVGAGNLSGTFGSVTDLGNGAYTALFTSTGPVGSGAITASIGGQAVPFTAPLAVVPAAVSLAESTVSIAPAGVPLGATATVTLVATDAFGNQETTGGLNVTFGLLAGVGAAGTFGAVTDHGNGDYSAVFTGTALGTNAVTAAIGGQAVTSPTPIVTVTPGATTTALSLSPAGAVYGQALDFSVTVSPNVAGFGTPAGAVDFYDGTSLLGSTTLGAGGTASWSTSTLAAGAHALAAAYVGSGSFAGSTSSTASATINPANTAVSVAASPLSKYVFGQLATLTATVTALSPSSAPVNGGAVNFYDGVPGPGDFLGTSTPVADGTALLDTSILPGGSDTIAAVYSGSADFLAAQGSMSGYTVLPADTAVRLISSASTSGLGQSVTFTAFVDALPAVSEGVVTFYDGATALGAVGLLGTNEATFSTSALTRTTLTPHTITAAYTDPAGDFAANVSPPVFQSVISAASLSVTPSVNPSIYGQTTNIAITVSGAGATPTGTVSILQGGIPVGSAALKGGAATIPVIALGVGTNALVAAYSGDANFAPYSQSFTQTVNPAATTTTLAPIGSVTYGQSVTLTATVNVASPGSGSLAGGTVAFLAGSIQLGTGTLVAAGASFIATYSTTGTQLAVGTRSITAAYVASPDFTASTSAAKPLTVIAAKTQTSLASSASGGAVYTQAITFTATVNAAGAGSAAPSGGTVGFYNGAAVAADLLGTAPVISGAAEFTTVSLAVGNHNIVAVYAGAGGFGGSTAILAQPVSVAGTAVGLTSSTGGSSSFGQAVTFAAAVTLTGLATGTPTGGAISFLNGGTLLGTVALNASGSASLTVSNLPASLGLSITAVYTGTPRFAGSSSAALPQSVAPAATSVNLTASTATTGVAVPLTFTAAVSAASGGVPTGSVTFMIDGAPVNVNLTAGKAVLNYAGFGASGPHTVSVSYNQTNNFAVGNTPTANINVLDAATVTLSTSPSPIYTHEPVTIIASVAGNGSTPTGSISFYDGAKLLGTAALNAMGQASIFLNSLAPGNHKITAVYSGDTTYYHTTTSPLLQVVTPQPTSRLV